MLNASHICAATSWRPSLFGFEMPVSRMWKTFQDPSRSEAAPSHSQRAVPVALSVLRSRILGDEQPQMTSGEAHWNQDVCVPHL